MTKLLLLFSLIFVFFSCAKPNYQTPDEPAASQQKPNSENPDQPEEPKECELFFTQERLCVQFAWDVKPANASETGSFNFKFYVEETPDKYIDPRRTPAIQLWMPSMGHGSSPVTVEKLSPGQYKAKNVFFIMPGEWEIRVQLKDGKNVVEQVVKKITI